MSLVEVGKNVIVRSRDVGVFAGKLIKLEGDTATVQDSRRLWYWSAARNKITVFVSSAPVSGKTQ